MITYMYNVYYLSSAVPTVKPPSSVPTNHNSSPHPTNPSSSASPRTTTPHPPSEITTVVNHPQTISIPSVTNAIHTNPHNPATTMPQPPNPNPVTSNPGHVSHTTSSSHGGDLPTPAVPGTNENVVGNQFSNNAIVYVVFGIKGIERRYDASHVIPEEGDGVSPC